MPRQAGTQREYIDLGLPAVCRKLAEAARRLDLSQRDLGRRADIDEKAAGKLLAPATFGEPQLATVVRLTRVLGLTLDGLFGLPATSSAIPPGAEPIGWIVAQRGWLRRRLAVEAHLSPQTISNIAAGRSRDLYSAVAIARAGGVSLDSLAAALLKISAPRAEIVPTAMDAPDALMPAPAPIRAAPVPAPATAPGDPAELQAICDGLAQLLDRLRRVCDRDLGPGTPNQGDLHT